MRLLLFAVCLSALGAGYAALVSRWRPAEPPAAASRAATPEDPERDGRPAVRTRVVVDAYVVRGQTRGEVLASMLAGGPRPDGEAFFGLTVAEVALRYNADSDASGCVLTDVEVDLAVTITLPDWTPQAPAEPALARDWGRFRRALAAHEDRHREIAEAGAASAAQALDGLRRASCAATEAEAQRRLTRLEGALAAAQNRYDAETDHGRTEGAVWSR